MKTGCGSLVRLVGFLLLCGMVFLSAPAVRAEQHLLDDIRQQPAIAASYDFSPVPPNGGKDITVAIVSQGITRDVKDLVGDRLSALCVLPNASPYEDEDPGIGNGVVSLVAALAPEAKIINIKALDNLGSGSYESIRDGINRATELDARIIVLPVSADEGDDGVTSAINAALKKGILVAACSGNNSGGKIGYPSNLDGVLAIGGSNKGKMVAAFSSVGPKVLYAPGQDVTSIAGKLQLKPHSGTTYSVGVAGGIFAVLWSQSPSLSRDQLVEAVQSSTKEMKDIAGNQVKLIDAAAALRAINDAKPAETKK